MVVTSQSYHIAFITSSIAVFFAWPSMTYADQFDPVARLPLGFWYGIDRLP